LKKTIVSLFVCSYLLSDAQQDGSAATFYKIQQLPSFKIVAAPDSSIFTNEQLKKNQPFVLMFFNPDCDHCQKETKELLAYKKELKDLQIVMASPASFGLIKDFYNDYNISSIPGIIMGQDINYALGSRYQLRTYPSIFVYDASGKLAKAFVGNVGVPAILDAVK